MKPHLVRDHLPALLPTLYAETVVKPDLIQTFQMGPWQHKVDTGQDARKTAWETLYTLVSRFPCHIIPYLTNTVPAGHMPEQARLDYVPHTSSPGTDGFFGRDQSSCASAHRALVFDRTL